MSDLIKCDNKLSIDKIGRDCGAPIADQVRNIVENIDTNLLAFEGLEVRNETSLAIKVKLVLVRATGRFFLYLEDIPCQCHPTDFKTQEIETLEGSRIVKSSYFEKVPISEAEF